MNHKKEYLVLFISSLLSSVGLSVGEPVYGFDALIIFCIGIGTWYILLMALVILSAWLGKIAKIIVNRCKSGNRLDTNAAK